MDQRVRAAGRSCARRCRSPSARSNRFASSTFARIAKSPGSGASTSRPSTPPRRSATRKSMARSSPRARSSFRPGRLSAGDYSFDIGTAGSCTLVFQTVLPALLTAAARKPRAHPGRHPQQRLASVRFSGAQLFCRCSRAWARNVELDTCELWILPAGWRRDPRAHRAREAVRCAGAGRAWRAAARLCRSLCRRDSAARRATRARSRPPSAGIRAVRSAAAALCRTTLGRETR